MRRAIRVRVAPNLPVQNESPPVREGERVRGDGPPLAFKGPGLAVPQPEKQKMECTPRVWV